MNFKPYLIDKILRLEKTQTRRLAKDGERLIDGRVGFPREILIDVVEGNRIIGGEYIHRPRFQVGKDVAICPGRGKYGVGRIKLTAIRFEDVRNISLEDIQAEGFSDLAEFYYVWTDMYDPAVNHKLPDAPSTRWLPPSVWQTWCEMVRERPADRYAAWCLTFCLEVPNDR